MKTPIDAPDDIANANIPNLKRGMGPPVDVVIGIVCKDVARRHVTEMKKIAHDRARSCLGHSGVTIAASVRISSMISAY